MHNRWVDNMRAEGLRPGTVKLRLHYLHDLARHVDPETATSDDLAAWLAGKDWGPETRKSARASLRSFYGWLREAGQRDDDPSRLIRPVRVPPGKPKPTPETVLEEALAHGDDDDRVILLLAAYAGLRRQEIAQLRWTDVGERDLRIRGKGGRTRIVPLHPRLEVALRRRPVDLSGWVLPSPVKANWHISADHIYRRVVDLTGGWTPHTLRHRFATAVYRGTHDIRATQELLGHSSPVTTQRYTLIDEDDLTRAVRSIA